VGALLDFLVTLGTGRGCGQYHRSDHGIYAVDMYLATTDARSDTAGQLRRCRANSHSESALTADNLYERAMPKSLYSRHNHVFLEMLRMSRKARSLRQRDVASLLGRGQATVSKVEAGVRRLDVIELRAWLRALDVDFVDFIDRLEQRLQDHADTVAGLSAVRRHSTKVDRSGPVVRTRTSHS